MVDLMRIGTESGVDVWADSARSCIEYRAPEGPTLRFQAFHDRRLLVQERMGAKITTKDSRFERATIDSFYFIPGWGIDHDSDHAGDATSMDEYYGRLIGFSDFPERVESLCRAQWHGSRFRTVVSLGAPRWPVGELPYPEGFPDDWPAADRIAVDPTRLAFHIRGQGSATRNVTLRNWGGGPHTVTIHTPTNAQFTAPAGNRTIAGGGMLNVPVRFTTHGGRTFSGTMDIDTPAGRVRIGLTGYSEFDDR